MRIGRTRRDDRAEFAIQNPDGAWVPISSIGFEAGATSDVIEEAEAVQDAIDAGLGTPIEGKAELACPILRPTKVMAIGLNYMDHIREQNVEPPEFPVVFPKYPNAMNGPRDPIVVDPQLTEKADYEAELVVVIGRTTRGARESNALEAVFGYCVGNDVSARDWQKREGNFFRGKSQDTFCPLGPWITTADDVPDPQALRIRSEVNGEQRQNSVTKEMVFPVAALIEFLSAATTLYPGDVILTGTPDGVGLFMDPPRFLQPGNAVVCEVEGLGRLENAVTAPS